MMKQFTYSIIYNEVRQARKEKKQNEENTSQMNTRSFRNGRFHERC